MAARQDSKGLVAGTKFFSPAPFAGMNVQASPIAIGDSEFIYVENFIRLGDGNYRTAWDVGTPLYTAPGGQLIVSFFFYTIGMAYYAAVFLNDGSAVQVNSTNGAVTAMAPPDTFYDPTNGKLPATTQWGTQYLLIANQNTSNDYWTWDGNLLYSAGGAAPAGAVIVSNGLNYSSLPTVTVYGGHGSGMVLTPTINAGGVVQLAITDPGTGYEVGDVVQAAFSGGGSDTSAILESVLDAGGVAAVNITAEGSGYTAATVAFSGGGGSGATGSVVIGYSVDAVVVDSGGAGYTAAAATIQSAPGDTTGSGALATVTVSAGAVTGITVTASGADYTIAPLVVITGDGTGATAHTTLDNGKVVGVTITASGTGYTSAPSVAISGDGTGATGAAILSSGGVSGVMVINAGSGFRYAPNIEFVGGGGTGATGVVQLNGTSIAQVNVIAGGANYAALPTVKLIGGGAPTTEASVQAVLQGGQVVSFNILSAGAGYTANVEVLITPAKDDLGTGAAAIAICTPTTIEGVLMSNYGQDYTDAPAVVISPGANRSAYAVVDLMPFGISGGAIETYQQRVWIVDQTPAPYIVNPPTGNFAVSAPGSLTDFATSDGGVLFTNSDRFLQTHYTNLRQSNGYLYFMGDGSVSVVSSVQASGNPVSTTFNYQNVDPQVGLSWRDSLQDFGRTLIFGNETGVYGLYGGSVNKVSPKLDQLFTAAVFPTAGGLTPTSAVATLFNVKHYLMLMTITDPDTDLPVNKMITWNERDWTITSQSVGLTYIGTQKVSSKLYAWGTDGRSLYPLFNRPSAALVKRMDTKHYGAPQSFMVKQMDSLYVVAQDKSGAGIDITASYVVSGITAQARNFQQTQNGIALTEPDWQPDLPAEAVVPPFWSLFGALAGDFPFIHVGARLTTTSPDFVLGNLMLSYQDLQADR